MRYYYFCYVNQTFCVNAYLFCNGVDKTDIKVLLLASSCRETKNDLDQLKSTGDRGVRLVTMSAGVKCKVMIVYYGGFYVEARKGPL